MSTMKDLGSKIIPQVWQENICPNVQDYWANLNYRTSQFHYLHETGTSRRRTHEQREVNKSDQNNHSAMN
jgi:hypothetical protein